MSFHALKWLRVARTPPGQFKNFQAQPLICMHGASRLVPYLGPRKQAASLGRFAVTKELRFDFFYLKSGGRRLFLLCQVSSHQSAGADGDRPAAESL